MGARAWCERCRPKEGARTISSTTVRASESRWLGSRLRNLRRRAAPHAPRLPIPSMVARRITTARPKRFSVAPKAKSELAGITAPFKGIGLYEPQALSTRTHLLICIWPMSFSSSSVSWASCLALRWRTRIASRPRAERESSSSRTSTANKSGASGSRSR